MQSPLSRRAFLGYTWTVGAIAAGSSRCGRAPDVGASGADLAELSATAAVAAMRAGDVTAEEYAQALLARVERFANLNAFRVIDREMVLASARAADKTRAAGGPLGLLHGLPIPVKDSVNTAALPTSNGTRLLEHFRPRQDAAVLAPLLAEGAYVMGKTNLHELSMGYTSTNPHFGAVRNPYNQEHVPGGSSGGSGAAVAARMAPLAIAEDTGGSIRNPAARCGITGLRPTYGRYPNAGIMPLTDDKFDQVGAVARRVEDLLLFDTVLTRDSSPAQTRALRGARLGVLNQLVTDLHPDVERITQSALERLEEAGAVLVRLDLPQVAQASQLSVIVVFEVARVVTQFLQREGANVTVEQMLEVAGEDLKGVPQFPEAAYAAAIQARPALQQVIRDRFAEHDLAALVYPASFEPAPRIGDTAEVTMGGVRVPRVAAEMRSTSLAPFCSLPGLVLPAGLSASGLPIGIEFDGLPGSDRELLAFGLALEQALGPIPAPPTEPGRRS
jgi:Asp-tRNA(Asn)/Glu-tRNA(Gln) amidotransferase A subunit family amidase